MTNAGTSQFAVRIRGFIVRSISSFGGKVRRGECAVLGREAERPTTEGYSGFDRDESGWRDAELAGPRRE